ncbi:MAG: winged helix-turn-helix domain-containing protein [Bryobacteraceae bacterium]
MAPKRPLDMMRFGVFEVDFRVGEVRKQGRRIRLQGLPFQFLTVLLERPGQLVTREELVRRLWSEYAAIDVDNGLNTAVKKLRVALGDDAETPRFVETLPRRGYRFISPVESVTVEEQGTPAAPARPDIADLPVADAGPAPAMAEPAAPRPFRRWAVAVASVLALGVVAIRLVEPAHSPAVLRTVQLTHTGRVEPASIVLTDGPRLYFNERSGGEWWLAQVSVEGGIPSPVRTPPGTPEPQAISPNRSELLAIVVEHNEDEAPLWVVPTVAGSPRRLGSVLAHTATWSRDGRGIVYGFGQALYRMNSDGTDPRKLADTPGRPYFVRWSPAGLPDLLRFSVLDPAASIWECAPDGSGLRPFPPTAKPRAKTVRGEFAAGWTADGRYYLFESINDRGTGFWAVREARDLFHPFDRRPLQIYATASDAGRLVPSADGKRIFFAAGQERRELVAYDAKRRMFLPFLSGASVRAVDFSKDGQWVAYETIPEGTLWRSRADGSERLQLTSPPLRILEPRWSPDGRRIAFTGFHEDVEDYKAYVIPANGGSMEAVSAGPYRHAGSPSWSPDGQSLMVSCWRPGEVPVVCMVDWKTGQSAVLPGSVGLLRPAWSPGGQYIAGLREGGTQVVLFDMQSHGWTQLADRGNYGVPLWTRDGRYFYFEEVLGAVDQPIFRVNVATRAVERMMSSRQLPQSGFSGFTLTGLTPGDAPIATVLRGNGELYALDVDLP